MDKLWRTGAAALTIVGMTIPTAASAQDYAVGQTVEVNMGSGPWMVCTVIKHNVKQTDYEVSCPARPADTFRAADDAEHLRPHRAGSGALGASSARVPQNATPATVSTQTGELPRLSAAPARSASNVLLGRWRLTDGDCNSLILEFSPRVSRDYNKASGGNAPYWGKREVIYTQMPEERAIYVRPTSALSQYGKINIRDVNHIVPDSMLQCTYTRM